MPTGPLNGKKTLENRRSSKHLVYEASGISSPMGSHAPPTVQNTGGNVSPKNASQLKNVFDSGNGGAEGGIASRKNSSQK